MLKALFAAIAFALASALPAIADTAIKPDPALRPARQRQQTPTSSANAATLSRFAIPLASLRRSSIASTA
jgi:hypothetical protein